MTKTNSRFAVSGTSNIEEKYVLYVEDLYVSFKGYSRTKEINKKIKEKEKILKKLNKKKNAETIEEIKLEIVDLKNSLEFKKEKKEIEVLKDALKNTKDKSEKNNMKEMISELEQEIKTGQSKKKTVLKGVTFGLRQGETLALVGANGAGKTVMLETILGFNIPEKYKRIVLNLGHKTYLGNLKEVGIQYQQSKIPTNLRVKKAIEKQKKLYKNRIDENEINKMIETFGVGEFIESKIQALSGGQKQRLNLLLAVLHQPKLMILDEFITGLDVKSVRKIITYVNELKHKNNASMIIVSHQPEEIQELSDRIIVMKNGKMVEQTTTQGVLERYNDMATFVEEVI